jgi:1-acyl-sn-glycerol-3-phosphate acyltransferase
MLYLLMRILLKLGLGQFFRRRYVRAESPQIEEGPLMVVGNHPNNLLDPLIVASLYRRRFWFLVKSTVFRRPWAWFLRLMHLVPVYRPTDGSDASKNNEMFRDVADKLGQGGAIMVFPEGTSEWQRQLLELKTGPARIALLAEARSGWTLGLRIQPVGLTYHDFTAYRGSVTAVIGEPIRVDQWRAMYEKNERDAVRDLTAAIEARLKRVTVQVEHQRHVELVEKLGRVLSLRALDDRTRYAKITRAVERLTPVEAEIRADLETEVDDYLAEAQSLGLVAGLEQTGKRRLLWPLSPLIALGWLLHRPPYLMTRWLLHRARVDYTYLGSLALGFGILVFLSWYLFVGAAGFLCALAAGSGWLAAGVSAVLAMALFAVLGTLANRHWLKVKLLWFRSPFSSNRRRIEQHQLAGAALLKKLDDLAERAERAN